jgi:hypothetical protein
MIAHIPDLHRQFLIASSKASRFRTAAQLLLFAKAGKLHNAIAGHSQ